MVNFDDVKTKHLIIKHKVVRDMPQNALEGINLTTHRDCLLGKWLYAEGKANYSHVPELKELEKIHVEFHVLAKEIIIMKTSGMEKGVQLQLSKFETISDKFLALINSLKEKIK